MHPLMNTSMDLARFLLGILFCICLIGLLILVTAGFIYFIVGAVRGFMNRNKEPKK